VWRISGLLLSWPIQPREKCWNSYSLRSRHVEAVQSFWTYDWKVLFFLRQFSRTLFCRKYLETPWTLLSGNFTCSESGILETSFEPSVCWSNFQSFFDKTSCQYPVIQLLWARSDIWWNEKAPWVASSKAAVWIRRQACQHIRLLTMTVHGLYINNSKEGQLIADLQNE